MSDTIAVIIAAEGFTPPRPADFDLPPIFGDFMVEAMKDEAGIPFRVPSGIRLVRVNAKTGKPAGPGDSNVILEAFKADDDIENGRSLNDLTLDPLSAARSDDEEDLNGLY